MRAPIRACGLALFLLTSVCLAEEPKGGRGAESSAAGAPRFASADSTPCPHPPAKLFLLRHGCRADCSADSALSANGLKQAEELVGRISGDDVDVIFISDRRRTRDTAAPLAKARRLEPIVLPATPEAVRGMTDILRRLCSGTTAKAALYVGHSNTLEGAFQALDLGGYKAPVPGAGWVISFDGGRPDPKPLPPSAMTCEVSCD